MANEIELKVRAILGEFIKLEETAGPEEDLADLGVNSLIILKVIVEIEEEFGLQFEDEDFDAKNFQNLNSLVSYIENKLQTA